MTQLDPSTSSISTPIIPIPSEQPLQEFITYMDSDLFKAAQDGDIESFNKYQSDLHCLVDGRKNTALHIYFRIGGRQAKNKEREFSINFVEQLVHKCPSLLLQPNEGGEIPLHIAARHGHFNIVKVLIELAKEVQQEDLEKGLEATCMLKQILRIRDKDGNTAMHKAVESGKHDVVRLLVKELDLDLSLSANKNGETPLYIAAMRRRKFLLDEILDNCKLVEYGGPDGRTALHAAVMAWDYESTKKLIEANKHLTKKIDDNGRTPLHYAALYNYYSIVKVLLESDASAAYITDKERGMTALHWAAWGGRRDIMEDIISYCPGCCEIVDKRGWNFLHFAVLTLDPDELEGFLLALGDENKINDLLIRNLVNEKDVNGNTPFHLLTFGPVYIRHRRPYNQVVEFFDRQRVEKYDSGYTYHTEKKKKKKRKNQIQHLLTDIANDAEVVGLQISPNFRMILEMEKEEEKMKEKKIKEEKMKKEKKKEEDIAKQEIEEKARESHLLVATLVATVTFTAAVTVPGGYIEGQGSASLIRNSAFKAFVVTNTLAFVASLLAITFHFFLVMFYGEFKTNVKPTLIRRADQFTVFAMAAMVIAFSTGTYAVLQSSLGFAIAALFFGLTFFPISLALFIFYNICSFFKSDSEKDE